MPNIPILLAHALDTGTNTDIDHARLDGIGNINHSLETRRTLSVQTLNGSVCGESSGQSSSTELGSSSTWCKDSTNGDILDELGIDL